MSDFSARIVVLVISSREEPYAVITRKGQRSTWSLESVPGVDVIYYYSDPTVTSPQRDCCELVLPGEEGTLGIGVRTAQAFNYVLENYPQLQYVYRTNTSSYVHLPGLVAYLDSCATRGLYSGILGEHEGQVFVSGSGYALSSDLVQLAVVGSSRMRTDIPDDLALSTLLIGDLGVVPTYCPRQDIINDGLLPTVDVTSFFHYRCKSDGERFFDILAMHHIFLVYAYNDSI